MKSVLFPATDLCSPRLFPLLLPASEVVIMQGWQRECSETVDTFTKAGFCQVECPHPIVETTEKERFLHLLADITAKHQQAAMFHRLTLAALSAESDEEKRGSIISALSGSGVTSNEERAEQWQSRLVLALGERIDREEEEIATALARIEDSTRAMFASLRGQAEKEADLDSRPGGPENSLTPDSRTASRRAAAWHHLFAEAASDRQCTLLLCDTMPAADWLINYCEAQGRHPVERLALPALPAMVGHSAAEAVDRIAALRAQNPGLTEELESWFAAAEPEEPPPAGWKTAVETHFPKQKWGQLHGEVYLFRDGFTEQRGARGVLFCVACTP